LSSGAGKKSVISFFKKGKSVLEGLSFLIFCGFYDIRNQSLLTLGCCFGKWSVLFMILAVKLRFSEIEASGTSISISFSVSEYGKTMS